MATENGNAIATSTQAITFDGFKSIEDKEYYLRNLLMPYREEHILSQFFEKIPMPKNHGKTMTWRKPARIKPREEVLLEGVVPEPNEFAMTEYQATINDYGDVIYYSDVSKVYSIDNIVQIATDEMGYAMKDCFEIKRLELLATTANVWFAGLEASAISALANKAAVLAAMRTAGKKGIVLNDLPKINAFFKRNHVRTGNANYFAALVPPEAVALLQTFTKNSTEYTWVEINQGQQNEVVYTGEEGRLLRFSFISCENIHLYEAETTNHSTFADCYILGKVNGKWGAAEIGFDETNTNLILKEPGSAGTNDPLNQKGSIGWKVNGYGGVVTFDEAVLKYTIYMGDNATEYGVIADNERSGFKQEVKFTPVIIGDNTVYIYANKAAMDLDAKAENVGYYAMTRDTMKTYICEKKTVSSSTTYEWVEVVGTKTSDTASTNKKVNGADIAKTKVE